MKDAIDNGILVTDLDANGFSILNIFSTVPPPASLVTTSDPRLSDARAPLPESVTNASVASGAAIDQSKLNLNGSIPANFLGFNATQAAQGNLAEYHANKGQPGGYASLDITGKVPPTQLPPDVGVGTITSVSLAVPAELSVSPTPITTSGTFVVTWAPVPNNSWLGNASGSSAAPSFSTNPIPNALIPGLDASKIVSGVINPARLPAAVGVGPSHASGAVPDPGLTGNPSDYLARDMTYRPVPSLGPSYQPAVPDPVINILVFGPPKSSVSVSDSLSGVTLFYKITGMTDYVEAVGSVSVDSGLTFSAYGARAGYNNSNVVTYLSP